MSHNFRHLSLLPCLLTLPLLGISECSSNTDYDGDGYTEDTDCDDTDLNTYPGAPELCDGKDNNCDGTLDEGYSTSTFYPDLDGDGYYGGTPLYACAAPAGYSADANDCDDTNLNTYPGAAEICDGKDNNCNSTPDDGVTYFTVYTDLDLDGYGAGAPLEVCQLKSGQVRNPYDCNDNSNTFYPAAPDTAGDGLDQSCDGRDGLAPSVGLTSSTYIKIQAALDAAQAGETVWVGPGTYRENRLTMRGKALRLAALQGESATRIDAQSLGSVFLFNSGESANSRLEGFTLLNGSAQLGGGIFMDGTSPTLERLTLQNNKVSCTNSTTLTSCQAQGGGAFVRNGSPTLANLTLSTNSASCTNSAYDGGCSANGAGLFLNTASPVVTGLNVVSNSSTCSNSITYGTCTSSGGGIHAEASSPRLSKSNIESNQVSCSTSGCGGDRYSPCDCSAKGGGVWMESGSPQVDTLSVHLNKASCGTSGQYASCNGSGAGMGFYSSTPTVQDVELYENSSKSVGGGLYVQGGTGTFKDIVLRKNSSSSGGGLYAQSGALQLRRWQALQNTSSNGGGGLYLSKFTGSVSQGLVQGNSAATAGGLYLYQSSPTLEHLTVSGNIGTTQSGGLSLIDSSPTLRNSILAFNTGLNLYTSSKSVPVLSYTNLFQGGGQSHTLTSLPATVTELDPGFVRVSADADLSSDDLHLRPTSALLNAGDPTHCTSNDQSGCDPDGSLPDLGAFGGPDADVAYYADLDADGIYDGYELKEVNNLVYMDQDSDQDQDGLSDQEELSAGTLPLVADSDLDGYSDSAEVSSGSDPLSSVSIPGGGPVVLEVPSTTFPTLQSAVNAIPQGGEGTIRVAASTLKENVSINDRTVTLVGAGIHRTILDGQRMGSVLSVTSGTLYLRDLSLINGSGTYGGGLMFSKSQGSVERVSIQASSAERGGGLYLYQSPIQISQVEVVSNQAYCSASDMYSGCVAYGGGIYVESSTVSIRQLSLRNNKVNCSATQITTSCNALGGGLSLVNGTVTLSQATTIGNGSGCTYGYDASCYAGDGAFNLQTGTLNLQNSVVAYHNATSFDINSRTSSTGSVICDASVIYNPSGWVSDTLTATGSCVHAEPKFLAYADRSTGASCTAGSSTTCIPSNVHLSTSSPLVNSGTVSLLDVDGSPSDIGMYGGTLGGSWNLDGDDVNDYFWPGTWAEAPSGYSASGYDCNDQDPTVEGC